MYQDSWYKTLRITYMLEGNTRWPLHARSFGPQKEHRSSGRLSMIVCTVVDEELSQTNLWWDPCPKSDTLCAPPFINTGVDYFGPSNAKKGRDTEKRWAVSFHTLPLASPLGIGRWLKHWFIYDGFEKIFGWRSNPKTIRSDNRTSFVGANREPAEALKTLSKERITRELAYEEVSWYFHPHMGRTFESMVKQVKRAMRTVINDQVLPAETLCTVLDETEVFNSWLFTSVNDNLDDYEALTPNRFLIGRESPSSQLGHFEECKASFGHCWF